MNEDKKNFLNFWQSASHSRLLLIVVSLVIFVLLITVMYLSKFGRQSDSVTDNVSTYTASPTTDTAPLAEEVKEAEKAKEPTKPSDSKSQSKTQAAPAVISSDTSVKTIVNELKNIDLDELSSSVNDLKQAVGQFNN